MLARDFFRNRQQDEDSSAATNTAANEDDAVSAMDRRVSAPRFTRVRLAVAGIVAAFLAAATYGFVRYGLERTLSMDSARLVISSVQAGSFHDYVPITGNVQPRETVYLDAIDGGQVLEVFVEEGIKVKKGQPLVRLNNTSLQLQVINSEGQLAEQLNRMASTKVSFEQSRLRNTRDLIDMGFQLKQSEDRVARFERVVGTGAISRSEYDDGKLDLNRRRDLYEAAKEAKHIDEMLQKEQMQQLDKTIASMNKNLTIARQNLNNLTLKAPIAGHLTSLDAYLGQSKKPGERLGQIDQIDAYKVSALVDEHYLPRVAVGQQATAEIDGREYKLELIKQYSEVKDRQFKIDLAFAGDPPKAIRRGQSLQLRLAIGATSDGLVIANGPFYEDTGGQWAFVIEGNVATRRNLKLGRRNPERIEVLEGLSDGERVITSSYESLKEFTRVELRGEAK